MIPVLMMPVLNRWDLAQCMVDSVDYPVDRMLVINNGRLGLGKTFFTKIPDVIRQTTIHTPPYTGLGYGGAINFMVMQNPEARWWLWVSNDVVFHPGHLESVARRMTEAPGPRVVTGGFTWGAVNAEAVDEVGLVDDWSFFPIYYDDNDYHYRCKLAGIEWIEDWAEGSTHGDSQHGASLTIRSDFAAQMANNRSFVHNSRAYIDKWGGLPGHETYTSPWDSGMPVWVTRPDISGRRVRQW